MGKWIEVKLNSTTHIMVNQANILYFGPYRTKTWIYFGATDKNGKLIKILVEEDYGSLQKKMSKK